MDQIKVYDNSEWSAAPKILVEAEGGEILYQAEILPEWLETALSQI